MRSLQPSFKCHRSPLPYTQFIFPRKKVPTVAQSMLVPGSILSMTATAADKLLKSSNGDAALLYIHLLRRGATLSLEGVHKNLGWSNDRTQMAYDALGQMGLVDKAVPMAKPTTPPEPDKPPEYLTADVALHLEKDSSFPFLVQEAERNLGKILSTTDLKSLLIIYDYLDLSAEVILMLFTWCVEDYQHKYGMGKLPKMSQVQKEAFAWKRLGVDTPEAADAHIRALTQLAGRERTLLPILGISGRKPAEGERKYIKLWVEMGFPDETIAKAYEITIMRTGKLAWGYMNKILKTWHEKGLHTPEQVAQGDSDYRKPTAPGPGATPAASQERLMEDMDWMDRFLEQTQQKEGT